MKISQTVFELQSGHDFVTDRRPGQKQYVSQPYGGRHNDSWQKRFVLLGQIDLPSSDKADTTRRKWLMAEEITDFSASSRFGN